MKRVLIILAVVVVAVIATVLGFGVANSPRTSLHIVSGSENRALQPIIEDWADNNRTDVTITYLGSVDIARALAAGRAIEYDAVWPANSLWIELGDTQRVVKHRQSVLRSPVVLGLRQSIAERARLDRAR
jgi:Ca-activated chloride channel family protein